MVLNDLIKVLDAYMIRGITFNMYTFNEKIEKFFIMIDILRFLIIIRSI